VTVTVPDALPAFGTATGRTQSASGVVVATEDAALPDMVTRPEMTAPFLEVPLGPVADIELPHATVEAASAAKQIHCRA
jgi:hypothetical protein